MNILLRILFLSALCLGIHQTSFAQQASIFGSMRHLIGARSAALGGSTVALVGDASNVVINPATIAVGDTSEVHGTFIKHVLDINAGLVTYATDVSDGMGAVTVGYMNAGDFKRSTSDGTIVGSFGASDVAIGLSFAKELDTLIAYGVTAKVMHSTLADMRSTALALDAGLLFRFPAKRTNVGISITNLGTQLSTFDGTADRLPLDMRIGLNHRLRGLPLMINLSLNHLTDDAEDVLARLSNFSIGGEFHIGKYVQARFAYDNATRNTSAVSVSTQLSGFSGGIGIKASALHFSYGFNVLGASAVLHRLSLSSAL
ncbi:MAG: PorV/PorQ family protein [Ignavibacteria bacterium]|nr:PorV/PorQ family protein [Ignavibacteria bacterium]